VNAIDGVRKGDCRGVSGFCDVAVSRPDSANRSHAINVLRHVCPVTLGTPGTRLPARRRNVLQAWQVRSA